MKYEKGTVVSVDKNTSLYPTYDSKNSDESVSGEYWIYNGTVRNKRVRITDSKDKVDVPCSMTGWVDIKSIHVLGE